MEIKHSNVIIRASKRPNLFASLFSLQGNKEKKVSSISIGSLFSINGKHYVLTCNHCTRDTETQIVSIYQSRKDISCNIVANSSELELSLLEINDNNINIFPYTLEDLNFELKCLTKNETIEIESCNIDEYLKDKHITTIKFDCIFCDISSSTECSTLSLNIPTMPFIKVKLHKKYNNIHDISGLSGSIVKKNNKIIGIISYTDNSFIYIIPSYCIFRFLNEFRIKNKFDGLCSFVGKYIPCSFSDKDRNDCLTYGIIIDDTYGITYNNMIKKKDIIFEINDNKILKNMMIYDSNLSIPINFLTYISLNCMNNDLVKIKLMRQVKDDYKEVIVEIPIAPLNTLKYIPMEFNGQVCHIADMTFIELNEDIINNLMNIGINTAHSVTEYYIDNPYRNSINEFVVILIGINKNKILDSVKKFITTIGLPIVPIKDRQHSFVVIKKINGTQIKSLHDLERMSQEKVLEIHCSIYGYGKLRIDINNNSIVNISKYR